MRHDPAARTDDLSSHIHRQMIGALGLSLPVLLWVIAGTRPMIGVPRWHVLSSVSAYYYTGAVAAFVGVLAALAVFLFTYRGYNNEYGRRDRVAAVVAGSAAILVAFFPTAAPNHLSAPPWWTPLMGTVHYISAIVLFCSFIFFSLFLFPKSRTKEGTRLPRDKQVRNGIYRFCGLGMVIAVLWAAAASYVGAPIFWPEAMALEFFAVSWLMKGRMDKSAVGAARQTARYARQLWQLRGSYN